MFFWLLLVPLARLVRSGSTFRPTDPPLPPPGQQVIEEQRRRLAELKQRAVAEAQFQWEALHGSQTQLVASPSPSSFSPLMACGGGGGGPPPLVHHSILHHQPPSAGDQPYDTLSLESSDSVDTSISTGNNSACSPDNMSRLVQNLTPCFDLQSHALIFIARGEGDRRSKQDQSKTLRFPNSKRSESHYRASDASTPLRYAMSL